MEENKNTLGGFEAIFDSFVPKVNKEETEEIIDNNEEGSVTDDELEEIKNNQEEPALKQVKNTKKEEKEDKEEQDEENNKNIKEPETKENEIKEDIEEPSFDEEQMVGGFFDAISEKLGWEFDENEEKPNTIESLIDYFQNIIEEESKPVYASSEVEALDNFVKQGGKLQDYLKIDAEIDLDGIDLEDEGSQKIIVKALLKEKGFSQKQIDKKISKYEDAGLLEDEAQDALEDLKEIRQQKKEQLLADQEKAFKRYKKQQQEFYDNVVAEIKDLKNIRGISIPEKDKRELIDYIFKPGADGKTKYQSDYIKGGVKNLIESAYFTKNADKLIQAAKREGNNSAIDKFKQSLRSTSVSGKTKQTTRANRSDDSTIWDNFTKRLRIS